MSDFCVVYGPGDDDGWTAEVQSWHYDEQGNVVLRTMTGVKHVVSGDSDWFITEEE